MDASSGMSMGFTIVWLVVLFGIMYFLMIRPQKKEQKRVQAMLSDMAVGDSVVAWGVGTADSYGGGATTKNFPETPMKVIGINNGRYALNQYNQGTPGNLGDVTGWFPASQVRK